MSAHLDWEIEAERTEQRAQEDPAVRRRRRRQRALFVLLILAIVLILGGLAAGIAIRLNTVDSRLHQTLIQTAQAEINAVQIGDRTAFRSLMRSSDDQWVAAQDKRFDSYQALKAQNAIQISLDIPDASAVVDGMRGRVLVNETVNGQPYQVLWFFWRYTDGGWRQVPADLTFWGDPQQIVNPTTTVSFDSLDSPLAAALADRIERWWTSGCQYLACPGTLPRLTVRIEHTQSAFSPAWDDQAALTLRIESPLAVGDSAAVSTNPLPVDLETAIGTQIANKLFDQASGKLIVNPNTDASWLRQSIIDWLTALLLGHGNLEQLAFMQSVTQHYDGASAIVTILHQLSPNADVGMLSGALGGSLETLNVDWREFFQWRLGLEKTLIQSGNQSRFLELWDQSVASAVSLASQRWAAPNQPLAQVQSVSLGSDPSLGTVATVQAMLNGQPTTLRFRVVDGTWKRLS